MMIQVQVALVQAVIDAYEAEAHKRQAILDEVYTRVFDRVHALNVTQESQLRGAIPAPRSLMDETLDELEAHGSIKRFGYQGTRYIAYARYSKELILDGLKSSIATKRNSEYRVTPLGRFQRYQRLETIFFDSPEPSRQANGVPLTPLDELHYSEEPQFGDGHYAAVHLYTYDEATLPTWEDAEPREDVDIPMVRISKSKMELIERQVKSGQGVRNTRRARQRYFRTQEGQDFLNYLEQRNLKADWDEKEAERLKYGIFNPKPQEVYDAPSKWDDEPTTQIMAIEDMTSNDKEAYDAIIDAQAS